MNQTPPNDTWTNAGKLEPDRTILEQFIGIVFKNADKNGFISLRLFPDKGSKNEKPIEIEAIQVGDKDLLGVTVIRAAQAANWHEPAVFCPPVCTFRDHKTAKTDNLFEGVCLSIDNDEHPLAARAKLEAVLGVATVVVASGGEWTDPATGVVEPKGHQHWRLKKPTSTKAEHEMLYEARSLATKLVGGDTTSKSIVHPMRWPGSVHRKGAPRLATIAAFSDHEIDLNEALDALREEAGSLDLGNAGFKRNGKLRAADDAYVASALSMIPNGSDPKAHDWDFWNGIGMKTWAATGGSKAGRDAFHAWSAKSEKYDKAKTDDRWDHYFTSPPTLAGFGSLVYLARENSPGWSYEGDLKRLNKVHAVLPIGGKTRVVTFGELPEFPGRETIIMTQSVGDFRALHNKYRHAYTDEKGKPQEMPLGNYWIGNPKRRQYDGGMAFMPRHEGDTSTKLNLWRGFGVKAAKPAGKTGAQGCPKFLDFMLVIICNGSQEHFEYLRKREATILQKRIRSEIALGLRTDEEGAGKGFYEKTMRRLLGTHAMLITNPKHIIGAFNPHLETLLRLTADEALFVGNHEHRNALFSLITEDTLTIEHKGCAVYSSDNYLNSTILSNAEHFVPISNTARRFFIPTVSAARLQDSDYFAGLQAELDNGGYEALLYHLLHEVDLNGFNIRKVPQTEALRYQRDQSLPPLEMWWCELLESGTLRGSDPAEPWRAVSSNYMRMIKVETRSPFGGTNTQMRSFNQPGLFDQARQIEPRLKNYFSDRRLGLFLSEMGCDNTKKVLRRQGWSFPPLLDCRKEWEKRYPGWKWRNSDLKEWQAEGDNFDDFE